MEDLFTTQEERDSEQLERVMLLPLSELRPFKDHPFKIQNDEEMERIVESIRKVGGEHPQGRRSLARSRPSHGGRRL